MLRFFFFTASQRFIALTVLFSALVYASRTKAATVIWDGGGSTNNWSDGDNWNSNTAPANPVPDADTTNTTPLAEVDVVQFAGTTRQAPVVDSAWYVDALHFNSGAGQFTLSGEEITLRPSNGTTHDGRYFLYNSSGTTQTIDNDLKILRANGGTSHGSGINVGGANNHLILNGDLDITNISGMRISGGVGTVTINGIISNSDGAGGDSIAINGGATAIFNGVNTYTKGTTVWNGTLKLGVDALNNTNGALGKSTAAVTMGHGTSAGARLLTTNAITVGRDVTLVRNSTNTAYVIGGETAHTSNFTGSIYTGADAGNVSALEVTAASGGRVNINSIRQRSNATGTLTEGTVTKTGLGIVALTGTTNTYAGQTNVNAGTFLVNGALSAASAIVNVSSGASLGGFGTIGRDINLAAGAVLTPGDMNSAGDSIVGTLTVDANLTLNAASILVFDIGSGGNDWVDVNGHLTLRGILEVTDSGGLGNGSYKLFEYDTLAYTAGDVVLDNANYSIFVDAGAKSVYLNVVPEPGVALLSGLAALGLVLRRHRRPAKN